MWNKLVKVQVEQVRFGSFEDNLIKLIKTSKSNTNSSEQIMRDIIEIGVTHKCYFPDRFPTLPVSCVAVGGGRAKCPPLPRLLV